MKKSARSQIALITPVLTFLGALLFGAGCSTCQYEKTWRNPANTSEHASPLEGRWDGIWVSESNGHTGRLRCVVTRTHGKNYRFDYQSTFWKVLRYETSLTFRVESKDSGYTFAGSEDLDPLAGGVYTYEGAIDGAEFTAKFKSVYDHGTFQMHKVN